MKILQVNCVYRKGSTGKIVYDVHTELQRRGVDTIVCYGRGERIVESGVYKICSEWYSKVNNLWSRITGLMYGGLWFSTVRLIKIIEKEKPDVVHLHCINGYFVNIYNLVRYLKTRHINTVLTLHAEFMHTANCGHALNCDRWKTGCGCCPRLREETKSILIDGTHTSWTNMKKAFDGFGGNLVIASVSPWLMGRAMQSPILAQARHTVVLNGLDTNTFQRYNRQTVRERMDIPQHTKVVFHATPSFCTRKGHLKGGYFVCELAKHMPDIQFFVAGPYADDIKVPHNVRMIGMIKNQSELAKLYSMADATVLTSQRETFSMVTAESLCCGTPVVGFKAGGPETIALPSYSRFVEYGNIDALTNATTDILNSCFDAEQIALEAQQCYSRERMTNHYISIYKELMNENY